MALELYIPPCIRASAHPLHPPPPEQSLMFPQPAAPELARLAYQKLYGREVRPEVSSDMVVRDEYLGWVMEVKPLTQIDYYGVTFDHLVLADDADPEVLQINIIEVDDDGGAYANKYLPFAVDPAEYAGKKVLTVPRCCQKRKGTQDRWKVNSSGSERDREMLEMLERMETKGSQCQQGEKLFT